jgi:hypothetical protein
LYAITSTSITGRVVKKITYQIFLSLAPPY